MKRITSSDYDGLVAFIDTFQTDETCWEYYCSVRWKDGIKCPHCQSEKVYTLKGDYRYKCGNNKCYRKFKLSTGTIFQDSRVPIRKWFIAMYLLSSDVKGVSSHQLGRFLKIPQATAWHMAHRIREAMKEKEYLVFKGEVEMDEMFFGPRNKFIRKSKRQKGTQGSSLKIKDAIIGIRQRNRGKVILYAEGVQLNSDVVEEIIRRHLKGEKAIIYTDESKLYDNVYLMPCLHGTICHRAYEYVGLEHDFIHTNSIEVFWSLVRRSWKGIYQRPSRKHIRRYCAEIQFRFNRRNQTDGRRFLELLKKVDVKLEYKELTKAGPERLPALAA